MLERGFCRVRWLKLKALESDANQSAVTFWCVTVGSGKSLLDTWPISQDTQKERRLVSHNTRKEEDEG